MGTYDFVHTRYSNIHILHMNKKILLIKRLEGNA